MTDEELLAKYPSEHMRKNPEGYYELPADCLANLCRLKDRSNARLDAQLQAARAVIDGMAKVVNIDPEKSGLALYSPDSDGAVLMARKMEEYLDRGGDKVKLKKRVDELEKENAILRTLIREGGPT